MHTDTYKSISTDTCIYIYIYKRRGEERRGKGREGKGRPDAVHCLLHIIPTVNLQYLPAYSTLFYSTLL